MAGNGRKDAPRNRGAGAVFWLMVLVVMLVLLDLTAEGVYASDFYTAPDGTKYNKHDYERLKAFLEQQNGGVKNGNKIEEEGKTYKPEDPGTWGGVTWSSDEPKRVVKIIWADKDLVGNLDLSECTALQELFCNKNKLSSLSVRNCNSLVRLSCYENQLTNLDLSGCSGLMILSCDNNFLISLDLGDCGYLQELTCKYNSLTSLDLIGRTMLITLRCSHNFLTSLDLSNCSSLKNLYCDYNQLTFVDLPVALSVSGGEYEYSPQYPLTIGVEGKIFVGEEIDLSAEAMIDNEPTEFTWYKRGGEVITPRTVRNGVFIFDQDQDLDDLTGEYFYCVMKNGKFPGLELETGWVVLIPVAPSIITHPQDTTVAEGADVTFIIEAQSLDSGTLNYQWQVLTNAGSTWSDITNATESSYTIPAVALTDNGHQYRCKVTNSKNGVSSDPVCSNAATLTVQTHGITFIKPTAANDISNPVNINSGSLVIAKIHGYMDAVESIAIIVDNDPGQPVTLSGDVIYYLLPANLSTGYHTITLKLTNTAGQEIAESVTFYWNSYRRGFGFGRFDFGEAPAGE